MKKARASKLDPYSAQLAAWLKPKPEGEALTLSEAKARLKKEFDLDVDISRISTWFSAYQQKEMENRLFADITNGSRLIGKVKKASENAPSNLAALMKLLETFIAQLAVHGSLTEKAELLPSLIRTAIDGERVGLSRESLALDRDKLEFLKAKAKLADDTENVVKDASLSDEQKRDKIKAIFGLA